MKAYSVYKKIMNGFTFVEKLVLSVTLLVVTLLTFGNVLSRYVLPTSWSFTEELTINVFVLLSLLGAAVCARQEGGLVSMALFSGMLPRKGQRILNLIILPRRSPMKWVSSRFVCYARRGLACAGLGLVSSLIYRCWLIVVQAFHPLSFQREKKAGGAGKKR